MSKIEIGNSVIFNPKKESGSHEFAYKGKEGRVVLISESSVLVEFNTRIGSSDTKHYIDIDDLDKVDGMRFVSLNGFIDEGSSYIHFSISGGDNHDSIGDQMWISGDGTEMEVLQEADADVLEETKNLFSGNSRIAFKGAMRRMGVVF